MLAGLPATTRTIDVARRIHRCPRSGRRWPTTAAAPRRHRMRRRHVGTGARPSGTPLPGRGARRARARRVRSGPRSRRRPPSALAHRRYRAHRPRAARQSSPTRSSAALTARLAASGTSRNRTTRRVCRTGRRPVSHAARLRYVAIRFAIRPTCRNAERFDRFALLDLDATRGRDPDWYDAFVTYTQSRALEPAVKKTMRRLIATADQTHSGRPTSTASTFPPPCCGDATTGWSRSRSAKPPHHAMAGLCTSSTAQPTPPTSNNPRRSSETLTALMSVS